MGYDAVPASSHTICQYAAFLAQSLTYASINSYLAIIGLLHKEFGLVNPLTDNWPLKPLLTGVKRVKGNQVVQKLPITLDILRGIYRIISLRSSFDASFWAVCLVAFYGFFRKSHLLPYPTGQMIRISSFPGPVLNSFPGGPGWRFVGVRPFSFGIGLCTSPCLIFLLLFCVLLLAFYGLWPSLSQLMHSLMPFAILTPNI